MDAEILSLASDLIEVRRAERDEGLRRDVERTLHNAVGRGILGAGFYAHDQEKRASREIVERADDWLKVIDEVIQKARLPWSAELADNVQEYLRAAHI